MHFFKTSSAAIKFLAMSSLAIGLPGIVAAAESVPDADPVGPVPMVISPVEEFTHAATWTLPTLAETREQFTKWLNESKASEDIKAKALAQWPADEATLDNNEQLNRVAASLAMFDKNYAALVSQCSKHRDNILLPNFDWLTDDKTPEFVRNNLRLFYGRWLAQERYYEEALVMLDKIEPKQVVDPVALLFYQSVNNHALLMKNDGLKTLAKLFERPNDLPHRFELLGRMMEIDLRGLKEDSLDHVSRRMNDITRRLEFGRTGKKVQDEEKKVLAALDKMIEELEKEKKAKAAACAGGGGGDGGGAPNGTQSSGPASDANIARGQGEGNITRKSIGSKSGWGDLPPKEREAALQNIAKEFPAHFREIVEEYFRRQAESE